MPDHISYLFVVFPVYEPIVKHCGGVVWAFLIEKRLILEETWLLLWFFFAIYKKKILFFIDKY